MSGWFFPEGGRFAFRREPLVQGGEAFAQEAAEGEAAGPIHGPVFEPDDGRGAEEQEVVETLTNQELPIVVVAEAEESLVTNHLEDQAVVES